MPPVKQFRVYSTTNGPNDPNLKEIPSQVEVWSSNYLVPTLKFAEWRKRFSVGDKLVFLVNFSNPGIIQQKVRIEWLWDADAPPPTYLIQFSISPPYAYLNNGVYELQLVANPGYSDWIDWSVSLHGNGYHVEYTFMGYDVHQMSNGGWWFPKKLPGGDWTVLPGPIRAVAYRENNITVIPPLSQSSTDELYHREIIIVPYGVQYFIYYADYKWLKNVKLDYSYLSLIGQISGTIHDVNSPYRMKYGGLQMPNEKDFVTGNYTIYIPGEEGWKLYNAMHRDRRYTSEAAKFGYWACQYGPYSGQAIFLSKQTYDLLTTPPYKDSSQLWVWSTADYARRVMEYDLIYWKGGSGDSYTIKKGTVMQVYAACFLYSGGNVSNPYRDIKVWNYTTTYGVNLDYIYAFNSSTGVQIPQKCYRMFVENYFPTIVSVTGQL